MRENTVLFQEPSAIISRHIEDAALSPFALTKRLFKYKQTGNNSSALPLTNLALTHRRGNDPFTARRAAWRHSRISSCIG